ncbi:MAG: BatA and WFA domain-containing protein [Verrucomicrobia bacterium]|nr:BatA and WFA domain-containing protein [Verrucomicrobiota bacterium]
MSFLAPLAFLFALSLPVVVTFYLLKRKRVVRLVPSTLLWQRFLAETQASAPFQRLRNHWLLWLQLLFLALIVLALARPYFAGRASEASLQVVILDASASMQSQDGSPTRFDAARSEALALVNALPTGFGARSGQMLIMVAGANAEVKQSATSEKAALRRALESARPSDSPTRLAEALRVATTLTRDKPDAEIHLFSDGAGVDLSEFENKDMRLVFHRIGSRSNNLGVVTLDVKANPENPAQRAIFASVVNPTLTPVDATLELRFNDQLIESKPVRLPATNTTPVVFLASQEKDGVFSVRLNHEDLLAADNEARVISRLPLPVRILLVSRGNRFLEKALAAAGPQVELTLAPDVPDTADPFDIVVLDDVAPARWPTANLLAFHVANTNWFPGGIGTLEAPPIVDWRNTHPVLRFVSLDNVAVAEGLAVRTPNWAVPLVESPEAPLVVAGELGRQRIVWVAFDPLQSTWPLRIGFPIFVANAVDWLNPATVAAAQLSVRSGEAFRMSLAGDDSVPTNGLARLVLPGGAEQSLPLDTGARELVVGDTGRQGVYRVQLGTNEVVFAVNLLDAFESNVTPREQISLGRRGEVSATTLKRANLEYWRWFALAALAVMMGEWWWFHRRTA